MGKYLSHQIFSQQNKKNRSGVAMPRTLQIIRQSLRGAQCFTQYRKVCNYLRRKHKAEIRHQNISGLAYHTRCNSLESALNDDQLTEGSPQLIKLVCYFFFPCC